VNVDRIHDEFPAPSYRGRQRDALERIRAAFASGNRIVLVRAPTGSGKSLLARAIAGCARTVDDAAPAEPTGAYYTTPQVSQLDDVAGDDLLSDLNIVRGKNNYTCILPSERSTPVDRAPCVREPGYDCSVRHRCPYFADRDLAAQQPIAAMTLAYFMQTAGSEVFRQRDVCVIDEAHGLAEWAEMYATIELDASTVPVWADVSVPAIDGVEDAAAFADALRQACVRRKDALLGRELDADEVAERDALQERISELGWFLDDYRDSAGGTTWLVDQPGEDGGLTIKPLEPERYLAHTVWDRASHFALLSATILNREAFCRQVGLDPAEVALVDVEHTFPVEHRPLYDVTCGKMTYEHRDRTIPKLARTLVRLLAKHDDEKGLVHCHSYAIRTQLAEELRAHGVGDRLWVHGRDDRDATLSAWKRSDDAGLLLSVKMEEALDLEGELARWQVICKAPYPNTSDARVAHRLEQDRWAWYYRTALRTVIQACGRVVRAPDDYGATYLADDSLLDLFERASGDVPDWFAAQVDRMSRPDLPPVEATRGETEQRTPPSRETGGDTTGDDRGRSGGRTTQTRTEAKGSKTADGSPLGDVWNSDR
jgi:Rad3-related DNA helicase